MNRLHHLIINKLNKTMFYSDSIGGGDLKVVVSPTDLDLLFVTLTPKGKGRFTLTNKRNHPNGSFLGHEVVVKENLRKGQIEIWQDVTP